MNVYARDEEYELICEEAKYLNDLGVDGIIVADGGIVDVVICEVKFSLFFLGNSMLDLC